LARESCFPSDSLFSEQRSKFRAHLTTEAILEYPVHAAGAGQFGPRIFGPDA
jgi:hypothetical protein